MHALGMRRGLAPWARGAAGILAIGTALAAAGDARAQTSTELRELRSELTAMRQLIDQLSRKVGDQERVIEQLRAPARGAALPGSAAAPAVSAGPAPAKTPEQQQLEEELARELAPPPQPGARSAAPAPGGPAPIAVVRGDRNYLNLSLDALMAGGGSTARDVERIETGGHDPSQRGFTLQNVEMVLDGAVDPYLRGQANIVLQLTSAGETNVEIEEAYLTSTSLPHNLQVKAGQFFTDFGRLNTQHPHTWDFVDQPLANGRFLGGDGLRGPGGRISWLAPTPFYSEFFLSAQNSNGETASSFRNSPGETQLGRPVLDRGLRKGSDLLLAPRYTASFDLSETQTVLLGLSGAFGPNGTGADRSTRIYGVDTFWKWKPNDSEAGFPFLKWQSEVLWRRFEAGAAEVDTDDDGTPDLSLPSETLHDWGGYSQLVWGFRRNWAMGLRGDYVRGDQSRSDLDATRLSHWRISPNLTWYPTEFSKFRVQLNHDYIQGMGSDESLWVQMEFILGAHAAHKF